jgi:uncharacterized protein (TIGR02466 family)
MKSCFETRIEQKSLGVSRSLQAEIERTLRRLPEMDEAGSRWSRKHYRNGYTSYGSLSNLHEQFTIFDRLKQKLDVEVARFVRLLGLRFPHGELRLSAIWGNIMPRDCYHAFHIHPNSVVSGTYYVSVPKGASPIRFEDPRAGLFMAGPPRAIQIDLSPRAGQVVLFESWLTHEVPPHSSPEERLSVSFNYDWIR